MPVITLNNVKVGNIPLSFDEKAGILNLAGDEITIDEWREIERRIETLVTGRAGLRKKKNMAPPVFSNFVTANLPFINKSNRGRMKKAPFWLKPFYTAVVTKEELHGDISG